MEAEHRRCGQKVARGEREARCPWIIEIRNLHPPSSDACGKIVGGIGSRKRERVGVPSVSGPR